MKGVLSMNTNMQEINEPAFHAYLKKAQASPNTIRSCLVAYRLYHSLYNDLAVNHLLCFKDYLIRHYKASTVNNRIYGINRYLDFLEEIYGSQMIHFRLTVIRTQQAAFLDNIIFQEDYETFKKRLKDSGNMLWYFVVRFLACTGARVSELIQIKAEHLHLGYIDLYTKGGKVRRLHFPDALCQEALEWLSAKGQVSGFLFVNRRGNQITARGISSQLKTLAIRCNIPPETVYPHSFRHRFAKNFLEKFNDISLLADLMGHESIETTRIYLTKSTQEQRELIDKIVTW